jgi:starch-binding outer membrane protein, SusD/RagB family
MKKMRIIYILTATVVLGTVSCKKSYLDTAPTDQVTEQTILNTTANAQIALNGIHRIIWRQYFQQSQAGQGSMMINIDNLGEDLLNNVAASGAFYNAMYRWDAHRNADNIDLYFGYYFYYRLISNANLLINSIDKAAGPEAEKKAIKGEALCYRAWSHFMLVQLFGKRYDAGAKPNNQPGVPLMLENSAEGLPRASVEDIYTQINKDLDDAISNLAGYNRLYKSHFNVNVAKGIKARVALTQQSWALAATLAAEARAGYPLMDNTAYLSGFNDAANPEWMWGSIIPNDQGTFFYSFFAFMAGNYSANATRTNPRSINSNLYNAITATDVRKQLWAPAGITPPANGTKYPYTSIKFKVKDINFSVGDVVYMRSSEMYLIEAEAKARLNQDAAAAAVLFTLANKRDPNYVLSTNTGTALINEIMTQRRMELWGEGFRFTDLKRTNSALDRTGANHNSSIAVTLQVPAGDKKWEWLIPTDEMNANKAAVQNPL